MTGDVLTIEFGALVKPIAEQLRSQSIELPVVKMDRFEKIAHAITMLYLNGMIPQSTRDNARKKLMKEISREVQKEVNKILGDA